VGKGFGRNQRGFSVSPGGRQADVQDVNTPQGPWLEAVFFGALLGCRFYGCDFLHEPEGREFKSPRANYTPRLNDRWGGVSTGSLAP